MEQYEPIRKVDLFSNDLYQFTCSYAYFIQNKHEEIASFQIFFRKYPFKGQYVILAGLQSIKDFVRNLKFTQAHQSYLKKLFPEMKEQYFTWIKQDFSSKVKFRSITQGEIVFANQPILSYTGPLGFVQMLETPCLTLLGFASLVATNASRMVKAVFPKKCMQFGTRRAQGPDGALSASQYAYIGGFSATSNVLCGQKLHIQCIGTMSHAYVTSFQSLNDVQQFTYNGVNMRQKVIQTRKQLGFKTHQGQLAAFLNFAQAFPHNFNTLIDTYSTLQSGILNTILVATALISAGIQKIGIRLDSGDLGGFSIKCRQIWNKYMQKSKIQLTIVASDDLFQERLVELQKQKSQVNIYAIGTNIATCKKQPALGLVCKLVELNGVPKMKLSSSPQKATYPCLKSIFRITSDNGQIFDLIALSDQKFQTGEIITFGNLKCNDKLQKKISNVRLLNDQLSKEHREVNKIKEYVLKSQAQLPKQIFDLESPHSYNVYMTEKYLNAFHQAHKNATLRTSD